MVNVILVWKAGGSTRTTFHDKMTAYACIRFHVDSGLCSAAAMLEEKPAA